MITFLLILAALWTVRNLAVSLKSDSFESRALRDTAKELYGKEGEVWKLMKEGRL